jgi:hypothetical protein
VLEKTELNPCRVLIHLSLNLKPLFSVKKTFYIRQCTTDVKHRGKSVSTACQLSVIVSDSLSRIFLFSFTIVIWLHQLSTSSSSTLLSNKKPWGKRSDFKLDVFYFISKYELVKMYVTTSDFIKPMLSSEALMS